MKNLETPSEFGETQSFGGMKDEHTEAILGGATQETQILINHLFTNSFPACFLGMLRSKFSSEGSPPVIFFFNGILKKHLQNLRVGPPVSRWNNQTSSKYALQPALPPPKKSIHQPQREEVEFQVPKSNGLCQA